MKGTIKNKKDIDLIFSTGRKIWTESITSIYLEGDRFMVTAPKKLFKKAVDRNMIKRLMREELKRYDIKKNIVFIYKLSEISKDKIKKDIRLIMDKIG